MWKTALLALIAVWLASPCDAVGPDEYRVLLAHAGEGGSVWIATDEMPTLDEDPPPETGLASVLERLGIRETSKPPGLVTRLLAWIGLRAAPAAPSGPSMMTIAILRMPDDRVVVAGTPTLCSIPGSAWITLHVVDAGGRVTKPETFSAGYRCMFPSTTRGPEDRFGGSCLTIFVGGCAGGSPKLQYYVLRGDRFVLVRLEHPETAEVRKNHYGAPNYTVGPDLPDLDANGWRARLSSDDTVLLLQALVWLGGVHLDVHRDPPEHWHEDVEKARVWEEIVTDERTKARLRELAESRDPWIAEAARCAMEVERYR